MYDLFGEEAKYKELKGYLAQWKIPKELRHLILKEMEMLNLIGYASKLSPVKIYFPEFNEEDLREYNMYLGFF